MIMFFTRGNKTKKLDFILKLEDENPPTAWHREMETISKFHDNATPKYVITSGSKPGISNPIYAMTYWM